MNSDLFKPLILLFWSYIDSVQMWMVSSSGMLVKSESISKRPILPPKKLNYADYLTYSELFYKSIWNLDVLSNCDLEVLKTKIKDASLIKIYLSRN